MIEERSIEDELAELADVEAMLDNDRRRADPMRGVVCVLGCSERPCEHVAYLVDAIKRTEEEP